MATTQEFPVSPPGPEDGKLQDFSEVIQRNVSRLFDLSHEHPVRTTVPTVNELSIGVPVTVFIDPTYYLYVKVSSTALARVTLTLV
jgi:hypothetical protein